MPTLPSPRLCNLDAALRRMGGNVGLLRQVIDFFHADAPALRVRLRQALDAGDASQLEITAHSLKGLVSNFDAERAVKAALRVEQIGHARHLDEAPAAISELERELDDLALSLDSEAARLG